MLPTNLSKKNKEVNMDSKFVPKINCRFKIRQDLNGFLGFFQGRGVLTFNEIGAFIVGQMTGEKSLQEIEWAVRKAFTEIADPKGEVVGIAKQLEEAGFF